MTKEEFTSAVQEESVETWPGQDKNHLTEETQLQGKSKTSQGVNLCTSNDNQQHSRGSSDQKPLPNIMESPGIGENPQEPSKAQTPNLLPIPLGKGVTYGALIWNAEDEPSKGTEMTRRRLTLFL